MADADPRFGEVPLSEGRSVDLPEFDDPPAEPLLLAQAYWRETMQQLRFEGLVESMTDAESDALFAGRSPASRAATAVARQSAPLDDDTTLGGLLAAADGLLHRSGGEVPRPSDWIAHRLVPLTVEFWQGSRDRMHRRLRYTHTTDGWAHERLQP